MSTPNLIKPKQSSLVRLSYSSMSTLQSCEQKYHHYKIANTPKDSDYVESDALGLGKAFHSVLEKNLHVDFTESDVIQAMTENNVDSSDKDLLTVMLNKYIEFRKASGFKVVHCELELGTNDYVGFIDFIAVRGNKWWIGDLKTASRHDETILSRLPLDPQLNLYAYFSHGIHNAVPQIDGMEFGGCLYNQTTKSKAGTIKGLENGVKVFETIIPVTVMNPPAMFTLFSEVHDRALELHKGEAPKKNFSSCFNYFSPCPYFSQCYGSNFSENNKKVTLTTLQSLKDESELL